MIILKTKSFRKVEDIAKFVNVNNIKREDILIITTMSSPDCQYSILFYADEATEEITRGIFGWDN
jgi:hypothetical protein